MSQTLPTILAIAKVIPEATGIKTLVFKHDLKAAPGQFVMLWLPRIDEKPFSVWQIRPREFRVTVAGVGPFSCKLLKMKVGERVGFRGPFGSVFSLPRKKRVALVGGGFGVAPLLFLAEQSSNCQIDFLIGARRRNLIFGENYARKLKTKVWIATNDGSAGRKGFVTDLLEKRFAKIDAVAACGPEPMLYRVAELCAAHKVPCELSLERYMKCGFGVCGSCAIDDRGFRACVDGPVIAGTRALQLSEFGKYHRDSVGTRKKFG